MLHNLNLFIKCIIKYCIYLLFFLLLHYGVKEHYITNIQVDLTIANSEKLPDLYIPVKEAIVDPETRLQNYVPGSPRTRIFVIGKKNTERFL